MHCGRLNYGEAAVVGGDRLLGGFPPADTLIRMHNPRYYAEGIPTIHIEEFRLLFPDEKLTTPRMADWCGMENINRVYRVLCNSYQAVGKGRGAITFEWLKLVKGKNSDEHWFRRRSCLFVIVCLD